MAHQLPAPGEDVQNAARDEKILDLRRRGWSFRRIAAAAGIGRSTACKVVHAHLDIIAAECSEHTQEIRAQEIERLDACVEAIWSQVVDDGNLQAIDRILRLSAQRASLLGLNAPTKVAATDPTGKHAAPAVVTFDLSRLSDAKLAQLEALHTEIQPPAAGGDDDPDSPADPDPR